MRRLAVAIPVLLWVCSVLAADAQSTHRLARIDLGLRAGAGHGLAMALCSELPFGDEETRLVQSAVDGLLGRRLYGRAGGVSLELRRGPCNEDALELRVGFSF